VFKLFCQYGFWGLVVLIKNLVKTKIFYSSSRIIRFPFRVRGRRFVELGANLTAGVNCRLDAFPNDLNVCLKLGDNVQINDAVHIAAIESVTIGDRVLVASNVFISDHNHGSYGFNNMHTSPLIPPEKRSLSSSPVNIGDDVWIGEFVCILPGVTIGNGSIIGAMSVVTKNIPEYSIAVGSPAKVIKQYDLKQGKWVKV